MVMNNEVLKRKPPIFNRKLASVKFGCRMNVQWNSIIAAENELVLYYRLPYIESL